jgi:hypothetical protein
VLYRKPMRSRSFDIPAIFALPIQKTFDQRALRVNIKRIPILLRSLGFQVKVGARSNSNRFVTHKKEKRYSNETKGSKCMSNLRQMCLFSVFPTLGNGSSLEFTGKTCPLSSPSLREPGMFYMDSKEKRWEQEEWKWRRLIGDRVGTSKVYEKPNPSLI